MLLALCTASDTQGTYRNKCKGSVHAAATTAIITMTVDLNFRHLIALKTDRTA